MSAAKGCVEERKFQEQLKSNQSNGWMFQIVDAVSPDFTEKDAEVMRGWLANHSDKLADLKKADGKTPMFREVFVRENSDVEKNGDKFALQLVFNIQDGSTRQYAERAQEEYVQLHRARMLEDLNNLDAGVRAKIKPSFGLISGILNSEERFRGDIVHKAVGVEQGLKK